MCGVVGVSGVQGKEGWYGYEVEIQSYTIFGVSVPCPPVSSPVIVVQCGDPGTPSNGGRTITSQLVGGRVTYQCNGGYRLVGSQTRNCVGDGRGGASWSGSLPTCEGVCAMSVCVCVCVCVCV